MKVFISYRRDDTGGRAGRLFDVLAARYGAHNVFQDVAALAPGTYFDDQVDGAIRGSDVVLVVIGRRWLDSTDREGGRRIDQPSDYVRHEVRAALESDARVVPVLVDDSRLPDAAELPDDLTALVRRQAIAIADASWRRDVDYLVSWLEGDPLAESEDARPPRPRRLRSITAAVAALVALAVGGLLVLLLTRDGADQPEEETADSEYPACDTDRGWTAAEVGSDPVDISDDAYDARITPRGAAYRAAGSGHEVAVAFRMENLGTPEPGSDDVFYPIPLLSGVLIDGLKFAEIVCYDVDGESQMEPGYATNVEIGFATTEDPAGASVTLVSDADDRVPFVSGD